VAVPARKLMADRAYDALKGWFQNNSYPPGTFLSERRLAAKLGMSKTPVKSALVRLEMEGFVRISPQQGIVVREPSVGEILDLFDLREALECFVVQKVAGKLSQDQVRRLRTNLKEMDVAVRARDVLEATRLDTEFHATICEFLANREITQSLWRMREKLHRLILGNLSRIPERMVSSAREHGRIAEALIKGDGPSAAERVREHLEYGRNLILRR